MKIVLIGMYNDPSADDGVRAAQFQDRICPVEMGPAGFVGGYIPQVAGVTIGGSRRAVVLIERVEMATRRGGVEGAAVAVFVNMKSMLTGGESFEVRYHS